MPLVRFPYVETDATQGPASLMPYMPITLSRGDVSTTTSALVDSGAALNVLSHDVGLTLGLNWAEQRVRVPLAGNISEGDAWAVLVDASVGDLPLVRIAFAWSSRNDIPTILGQVNFFITYDVSFHRLQSYFTVAPANGG